VGDPRSPSEPSLLERPDEHEAGAADELYCWMATMRECGPDCVAFEEQALQDPRMTTCKALNAIRSTALSFTSLARAAQTFTESSEKAGKKQASQELAKKIKEIPDPQKVNP